MTPCRARRRPRLSLGVPALLLLSATMAAAHTGGPPLPVPGRTRATPGVWTPRTNHRGRLTPENLRTRIIEHAVARAGGWRRWRLLEKLFLRVHRRRLNPYGRVLAHQEESLVYTPEGLTRYWEEDGLLHTAVLEGRRLALLDPGVPRGAPEALDIGHALEVDQFWIAHPFLLYRPGIRTRYLGTRPTRGTMARVLEATFAPGAAPYAKVVYSFDPIRGDLLVAEAHPLREGDPVEVHHFQGRVEGPEGLRLPRRRERLVGGVVREVAVLLDVATRPTGVARSAVQDSHREKLFLPARGEATPPRPRPHVTRGTPDLRDP